MKYCIFYNIILIEILFYLPGDLMPLGKVGALPFHDAGAGAVRHGGIR
jgi:hypothetical protein